MTNPEGTDTGTKFLSAFKDVLEFQKEAKEKNKSDIQVKIVLNRHMSALTDRYNEFIMALDMEADEKIKILLEGLNLITRILNNIPGGETLQEIFIDYSSLSNFIRATIANIHYDSDSVRNYSSALMLSQLLLGDIKRIEKIPEMPDYKRPSQYFKVFVPLANNIQSTTAVYQSLIDNLSVINQEELREWGQEIIWHFSLMLKLLDQFDVTSLLETKKIEQVDTLFNNIYGLCSQLVGMYYVFPTLYSKFGGQWPEELETYGLIEGEVTISSMQALHKKVLGITTGLAAELVDAYNRHLINRNNNPKDADYYYDFELVLKDMAFLEKMYDFYARVDDILDPSNLDVVKEIIKEGEDLIKIIVDHAGGESALLESFYVAAFLLTMREMLPFLALHAVYSNSETIFENYRFKYRFILDKFDIEDDSHLYITRLLAELFVYTRLEKPIDTHKIFEKLNNNYDLFQMKPREYVAVLILIIILSYFEDDVDDSKRTEYLQKIKKFGFMEGENGQVMRDYNRYEEYLLKGDQDKLNLLRHRKQMIRLDIFSWMYPDFRRYFEMEKKEYREYLPFNREIDSLLD